MDHEAELPAENVETFQITSSKNSSNILDTAPVIVTISQSNMTIDPPKDTVKEEAKGKLAVLMEILRLITLSLVHIMCICLLHHPLGNFFWCICSLPTDVILCKRFFTFQCWTSLFS